MPKFDLIVGNPPYEKAVYKQFLLISIDMLTDCGIIAMITPSSCLSGDNSHKFRETLHNNVCTTRLDILPTDVFHTVDADNKKKPMKLSTVVSYHTKQRIDNCVVTRRLNDNIFKWLETTDNIGKGIRLYYDEVGKSIYQRCEKYSHKFDISINTDYRRQKQVGPNVNIGAKTEMQYLGTTLKLNKLSGSNLWTGKCVDHMGDYEKIKKHKEKSNNHRYLFKTTTAEQSINLGKWMSSKLFGILLSMTGTNSDVSKNTVGQWVLNNHYDNEDIFLNAVYDELELTTEERNWIVHFG